MSEEQVSAVLRRRSQEEADHLAAEFESSGRSRREFCLSHGLKVSTLDGYRKRRRQRQRESGSADWLAVEVKNAKESQSAGASGLAVVLAQGRRIEVSREFDVATLERLLSLIERA